VQAGRTLRAPTIVKPNSRTDREQTTAGEFSYAPTDE